MVHERNIEGLRQSAQLRHQRTMQKLEEGISRLLKEGRPVNFNTVAQAAGVSTAWLYQHPEVRGRIEHLRAQQSERRVAAPKSKASTVQSHRTFEGTENQYLFMDVLEGPVQTRTQLVPDSPDWFAWLAQLGSFHFQGKSGHFTARQERKQRGDAYWYAYRKAHALRLKRYLGTTDKLTLGCLEQIAGNLHAAALGAIPEDEALNVRSKVPPQSGSGLAL